MSAHKSKEQQKQSHEYKPIMMRFFVKFENVYTAIINATMAGFPPATIGLADGETHITDTLIKGATFLMFASSCLESGTEIARALKPICPFFLRRLTNITRDQYREIRDGVLDDFHNAHLAEALGLPAEYLDEIASD